MSDRNRATDERPPFIIIDQSIIDEYNLHPLAGWLYVVIVRHVNRKNNDAFPSVARLAKLANMSRASVLRYTKVLEDAGLIRVDRDENNGDHQVNHYRLLHVKGGIPKKQVVSHSNHKGGISQQPQVVSHSNTNQIDINQSKEHKNASAKASSNDYVDVAKDDRLQIIKAWADALGAAPIGAYKNDNNHRVAAEIFREGYRAPQVALFVNAKKQDAFWHGKTLTLAKVAELMPEWLLSQKQRIVPDGVVQHTNRVPVEWGVNEFVRRDVKQ